jgi:ferredoxin hydrogenase small subunit
MKENMLVQRRSFIKLAAVVASSVVAGFSFVKSAFAEASSLIMARNRGTYDQDARMPLRKSQDNPEIRQIYERFLHEPNSHEAHHLLHTEYVDRSARIRRLRTQGINPSL